MSRTFAYIRVSKYSQDADNQIGEMETAGFSGSSAFLMGKFMQSSRNPLNPSKVFEKATHS